MNLTKGIRPFQSFLSLQFDFTFETTVNY